MKLGIRRPSTLSRRSSGESCGGELSGSNHSAVSGASYSGPSVIKPSVRRGSRGSGHRRFSDLRSSIVSMVTVDTVKASNSGAKGGKRSALKSMAKKSFLSKSFKKQSRRGSAEKEPSLRLDEALELKPAAQPSHRQRSQQQRQRRISLAQTVATAGTASVVGNSSGLSVEDNHDSWEDSLTKLREEGTGASQLRQVTTQRRATLGSIPDGIDCIEDPDAHDHGHDHDHDDRSQCSDLTGTSGLQSASDNHGLALKPNGRRRGSIERPAAQGRRRSSLCRIPDGIALLRMSEFQESLELDDDDISAFNESGSGEVLNFAQRDMKDLSLMAEGMTIEEVSHSGSEATEAEPSVVEVPRSENAGVSSMESSPSAQGAVANAAPALICPPSALMDRIQGLDHRSEAERASKRRAMFEDDPLVPAFPALAAFVETLSKGGASSAPVNLFPVPQPQFTKPAPPSPPSSSLDSILDRVRARESSSSVLDRLTSRQAPAAELRPATPSPPQRDSALSSALDRIQGPSTSSTSSVVDRLLSTNKPSTSVSALDRLLSPPGAGPSSSSPSILDRIQTRRGDSPAATSSFIDSYLQGRPAHQPSPGAASAAGASPVFSAVDRLLQAKIGSSSTSSLSRPPRPMPSVLMSVGASSYGGNTAPRLPKAA